MPVPTITSITPSNGHTGGLTLVQISGSGFIMPAAPPEPLPGPQPAPAPRMRVTFGGSLASRVEVVDGTTIQCLTPICPVLDAKGLAIPGVVDVDVQVLDADGEPVVGEAATLEGGFEYLRPDITQKTYLQYVVDVFMEMLRLQVVRSVDYAVHSDFGENGDDALDPEQLPQMPCIGITDVEFIDSVYRPQGQPARTVGNGAHVRKRQPSGYNINISMAGITETSTECTGLMVVLQEVLKKNTRFRVPASEDFPSIPAHTFALRYENGMPIRVTSGNSNGNIKSFTMSATIFGVPILGIPGLPEGALPGMPSDELFESTTAVGGVVDDVRTRRGSAP